MKRLYSPIQLAYRTCPAANMCLNCESSTLEKRQNLNLKRRVAKNQETVIPTNVKIPSFGGSTIINLVQDATSYFSPDIPKVGAKWL